MRCAAHGDGDGRVVSHRTMQCECLRNHIYMDIAGLPAIELVDKASFVWKAAGALLHTVPISQRALLSAVGRLLASTHRELV